MKNLLAPLFFALCIIPFVAKSQTAEKGSIRGKVVEEIGGLPIPYAVVAVIPASAELPTATYQTDEVGAFSFRNLKDGIYSVKVSFVGFSSYTVNEIYITASNADKNIGTIKLAQAQNSLTEVVITGEKPLIETDGDLITYNVGASLHAEGSSAVDILKDVPMVEVDIDGKPSISGMRSTRVFINGKPSDYMTANIADLLNVLPSDAVEKIEVMTNPPARYSADGEGIINIVLRKDFKVGFNGGFGVAAGLQGNKAANANASYKDKNYSINGGGSFRGNKSKNYNENFRTNIFPDTTYYYNQYNDGESESGGANFRMGVDWDIDKKQNLKMSTNFSANQNEGLTNNDFYYLTQEFSEKRLRKQLTASDAENNTFVFNADYRLRLDTSGNGLSLGLTFNTNTNQTYRSFDRKFVFPTNLAPSLQQNNNDIGNYGINFNLDYEKILSKRRDRLEVGVAIGIRENQNDLLVENYSFKNSVFTKNEKLSGDFVYHEKIYATYASYNYRQNGWTFKGAIRGEYTNVDFDLSTAERYVVNPYFSVFPSLSASKYIKKKYSVGVSYGMRVNRPREQTLNPQVNNADTSNISYGNPNLTPSYTHQVSLNMGTFGKNWSFNPRITYSRALGVIERYRFVSADGVSESTYDNVGSNYYLSYILVGNYRPSKKTSLNGNFTLIQSDYASSINPSLNRTGFSVRSRIGFSLQLSKRSAAEGSLNYANNLVAQGRNRSSVNSSLGFRQNFLKNKLSTRITANDPFRGRHAYSTNEGNNFFAESASEYNTNNFTLNINYRFSRIKVDKVKVPPASKLVKKANL